MSTPRQALENLLSTFSAREGQVFSIDEKGRTSLQDRDGNVLTIQATENGSYIYFNAMLGQVPPQSREAVYAAALTLNLFQHDTRGASIALDPIAGELVLSYAQPVADAGDQAFSNVIQNLLSVAGKLKRHFADLQNPSPLAGTEFTEPDFAAAIRA